MKPTKKKTAKRKNGDTPKGMLIMKLKKLGTAIEMKRVQVWILMTHITDGLMIKLVIWNKVLINSQKTI